MQVLSSKTKLARINEAIAAACAPMRYGGTVSVAGTGKHGGHKIRGHQDHFRGAVTHRSAFSRETTQGLVRGRRRRCRPARALQAAEVGVGAFVFLFNHIKSLVTRRYFVAVLTDGNNRGRCCTSFVKRLPNER
jgi:hypothetical protein